jgi:L-alanine-DL-glutamate epimerase-like enolase superfamily enzyme
VRRYVARPAEAAFGSATAVVAVHADGLVGLGEASPQGGVASLAVVARDAPALIG